MTLVSVTIVLPVIFFLSLVCYAHVLSYTLISIYIINQYYNA